MSAGNTSKTRVFGALSPRGRRRAAGFTIVELLSVVSIIGLLAGLGIPKLHSLQEKARIARAIGDIRAIQIDLMAIEAQSSPLPATLADIGRGEMLDPWGAPYQYLNFSTADTKGNGDPAGARKDKFLKPLNSTFDLYSMGADGETSASLSSGKGRDDIVRANDGGFIGLASRF